MNHKSRAWGIAYVITSAVLCTGITVAGFGLAVRETQKPAFPVPTQPAPVLAIRAEEPAIRAEEPAIKEPAISAVDLWSDDRNRIDTLLVSADLAAETQWAIFGRCGQDVELFCAVMSIAATESDFNSQKIGDDGDSIGMMQINIKWHIGRMEELGVTDLTDPIQCAVVAIDYLLELEDTMRAGPGDHALYMAYNAGPDSAKQKIRSRTTVTEYSTAATAAYLGYIEEMGVTVSDE